MSSLEDLFSKIAVTTVTTVSRIALSHATNAAIRNVTSYVSTQLPKNKPDSREIQTLQRQLDLKIKNLKPTIDIIARSVADGNQDLEPALEMCNDLKTDMDEFAQQVESIKDPDQVKSRLRRLLNNIDDAIPSLHLSLRSIENKMGTASISPSQLIQASHILSGKSKTFVVKLYSLFAANQRASSADAFTWKEEFHKADATCIRKGKKFDYSLVITEDFDDGLYHEEGEEKQKLDIDVGHIDRMYYTQSGELLNIEDAKSPVLVLKVSKTKKKTEEDDVVHVKESNPEIRKEELKENDWYAIGLWSANDETDEEEEEPSKKPPIDSTMNLLLLENVVKLALLEITEQMDHTVASDELINLYMK